MDISSEEYLIFLGFCALYYISISDNVYLVRESATRESRRRRVAKEHPFPRASSVGPITSERVVALRTLSATGDTEIFLFQRADHLQH